MVLPSVLSAVIDLRYARVMKIAVPLALAFAFALAPQHVSAQGDGKYRVEKKPEFTWDVRPTLRFDAHFLLGYYEEVGGGVRAEFAVVPNGLISGIEDSIYITGGADFLWFYHPIDDGFGAYPVGAGQWNFHPTQNWSVFAEVGIAGVFAPNRKRYWKAAVAPYFGVGARYHFAERFAFLARITWPTGAHIGIVF